MVHMRAICRPFHAGGMFSSGSVGGSGQPFDGAPAKQEEVQGGEVLESISGFCSGTMSQRSLQCVIFSLQALCTIPSI